ncbi:MAG: tetratricopeptide repeat protein [Pseudomonadota bacterium]
MMNKQINSKQNRIRETLDRLYDQQPPQFREQLRKLQQDPSSRVFAPLAESYRRLGRLDEAIEICQRGLEHHPDFHGGRVALAKCYIDKQRYQDAQRELEKVVHLAPENLLAQKLLGEALMAQGFDSQALHAFKMALLLAPCDVSLTDRVHQLEKQVSNPSPIQPAIEVAISSDEVVESTFPSFPMPESEVAESSEVEVELNASVNERQNWQESSFKEFPLAETTAEEDEIEEDHSAQVNAVLGFADEGEEIFSVAPVSSAFKILGETPSPEITTETLGDLYFSQGQYGHALKIFEKIFRVRSSPDLENKMKACRIRLGVDPEAQIRDRKIRVLKGILLKLQESEKN